MKSREHQMGYHWGGWKVVELNNFWCILTRHWRVNTAGLFLVLMLTSFRFCGWNESSYCADIYHSANPLIELKSNQVASILKRFLTWHLLNLAFPLLQLWHQTESPSSQWVTWLLSCPPRISFPVTRATREAAPGDASTEPGGTSAAEGKDSIAHELRKHKSVSRWFFDETFTPLLSFHRVVTEECYPYRPPQQTPAEVGRCMMQSRSIGRGKRQATQRCPNTHNYQNDIYQSTPPYRLSSNVSQTKNTPTHACTPILHQFNTWLASVVNSTQKSSLGKSKDIVNDMLLHLQ